MNKLLNLLTLAQFPARLKWIPCGPIWGGNTKIDFMPQESRDGRSRNYILMRMLMDVGMGIIYIGMAMLFLFASRFGLYSFILEPPFNYIFAGICIAYGSFRIYRGVKKNYFRS